MWNDYQIEPGFYWLLAEANGYKVRRFLYVVVESSAPHICEIYQAGCDVVEHGKIKSRQLLADFDACRKADNWPGYVRDKGIDVIGFPTWAQSAEGPGSVGRWLVED